MSLQNVFRRPASVRRRAAVDDGSTAENRAAVRRRFRGARERPERIERLRAERADLEHHPRNETRSRRFLAAREISFAPATKTFSSSRRLKNRFKKNKRATSKASLSCFLPIARRSTDVCVVPNASSPPLKMQEGGAKKRRLNVSRPTSSKRKKKT